MQQILPKSRHISIGICGMPSNKTAVTTAAMELRSIKNAGFQEAKTNLQEQIRWNAQ
jgi:hypothetical protein